VTRLWRTGLPITVMLLGGRPAEIVWGKRRWKVARIAGHWRVDTGWWRFAIQREYFLLELAGGSMVTIYGDAHGWRLSRLYD
jgi:hypothetical protein